MFLRNDLDSGHVTPEVSIQDFCAHILRISTNTAPDFVFNTNSEKMDNVCARLKQLYTSNEYAPRADSARANTIIRSPTFIKLRNKYADQTQEEMRYEPFVKLANFILQQLRGRDPVDADLVFVKHNSQVVQGLRHYDRYPDIVGMREKKKMYEDAPRSRNWDKNGPDMKAMHYRELLFFVELEQERNQTNGADTFFSIETCLNCFARDENLALRFL
jgi:hypothetical protein